MDDGRGPPRARARTSHRRRARPHDVHDDDDDDDDARECGRAREREQGACVRAIRVCASRADGRGWGARCVDGGDDVGA